MLASFWLGRARTKEGPEEASGAYAWAVLFHLFFVTLLPLSMIVVGRYNLAPAICVYAVNMVLLAGTAIGITLVIERDIKRRLVSSGRLELGVLIASALLSVAMGFYSPSHAMYAYFVNFASPLVRRDGAIRVYERAIDSLLGKCSTRNQRTNSGLVRVS